jgi:hypothetical protein
MRRINPLKAGASVGAVTGLFHLIWATLVGLGWAKALMDLILRLHFLDLDDRLAPFSLVTAATLVFVTTFIGMCLGFAFALIWNRLTFETGPEWERDTTVETARVPAWHGG